MASNAPLRTLSMTLQLGSSATRISLKSAYLRTFPQSSFHSVSVRISTQTRPFDSSFSGSPSRLGPTRFIHLSSSRATDTRPPPADEKYPTPSKSECSSSLKRVYGAQHETLEQNGERKRNDSAAPQSFSPPAANYGGSALPLFGPITKSPTIDAALTAVVGLVIVFISGVAYLSWYKARVLDKIELAFAEGYDPALELLEPSNQPGRSSAHTGLHIRRKEQDLVDDVIGGRKPGQYFLIMGPKGTGKGSMVLDAMHVVRADGVAFCEAHEDLEVFRLRLGRALNFEYMEDSQTGLFQRRDPREGGPALDIERALTKLEKVALRMKKRRGKPLVLCISNIHMFDNNEDSRRLLLQLQQRAESWAASGILTLVFTTDDFWPYPVLRKNANRLHVVSVSDLSPADGMRAFNRMRGAPFNSESEAFQLEPALVDRIVELTGGRMALLGKIAHAKNEEEVGAFMDRLLESEKAYLLSRIGLIPDHDDDVMDEQKWSSCSWLLIREFVKMRQEDEKSRAKRLENGETREQLGHLPVPAIPYWRCRQIMTRPDFLEELDHDNITSIDVGHNVRLDSALLLCAAREVVEEEGFDEMLDNVRARVDEIESLHRTRELTFKDLQESDRIRLEVDKGGRRVT